MKRSGPRRRPPTATSSCGGCPRATIRPLGKMAPGCPAGNGAHLHRPALLKNAPIVLLDEATASLDVENETKVQEALSRLLRSKTVLVIAHRMRTVAGADHIVVLENGRVAEEGTAGGADGAGRSLPPHGGTSERERTVAVECRQMIGRQKAGDLRESPAFCPV